uniref:Uncharacterized protein n=1 Tax=Cacopsylla melanoneura TaxID=428564 RepID=A0A8D9C2K4_9HEMI
MCKSKTMSFIVYLFLSLFVTVLISGEFFDESFDLSGKLNYTESFFERVLSHNIGGAERTPRSDNDIEQDLDLLEAKLDQFENELTDLQDVEYYLMKDENVSTIQYFTSDSNITIIKGNISSAEIALTYCLETLSDRMDATMASIYSIPPGSELNDLRIIFMKNLHIDEATCDNMNITIVNNMIFQPENIFTLNQEEFVNGCIKVNAVHADWILTENIGYDNITQKSKSSFYLICSYKNKIILCSV